MKPITRKQKTHFWLNSAKEDVSELLYYLKRFILSLDKFTEYSKETFDTEYIKDRIMAVIKEMKEIKEYIDGLKG